MALPELYGCYSGTAPAGTPRTLRLLLRYCACWHSPNSTGVTQVLRLLAHLGTQHEIVFKSHLVLCYFMMSSNISIFDQEERDVAPW